MYWDVESNPLTLAMLVDTDRQVESGDDFHDLLRLMKIKPLVVFEETREVDGRNCILYGEPNVLVYLDQGRNFCLAKFEHTFDPPDARPTKRETRTLTGMKDFGNGLWLPDKIVVDHFTKDGKPESHREVVVKEWHVNEGIPDDYFQGVIPTGSFVNDAVNNLSYKSGEGGSIDQMLSVGEGRTPTSRGWWTLAGGMAIATALILIASLWRRGHRTVGEV